MAPLARKHKYLWFSAFRNFRKVRKFAASIERTKAVFQLNRRGMTKGCCARGTCSDPDRLELHALAMASFVTYATVQIFILQSCSVNCSFYWFWFFCNFVRRVTTVLYLDCSLYDCDNVLLLDQSINLSINQQINHSIDHSVRSTTT